MSKINKQMMKLSEEQTQKLITHYKSNNFRKLEIESGNLIKKYPSNIFLYNMNGIALAGQKKFTKAIKVFYRALTIEPKNAELYCNIGNVFLAEGKINDAIKNYKTAIKNNKEFAEAYYNLGNIQKNKSDFNSAVLNYTKAIKIKPNYEEAYSNLGNIKKYQRKFNEAREYYNSALKVNPNSKTAYINLSYLNLSEEKFKMGWEGHEKRPEINFLYKKLKLNKNKLWDGKRFTGNLMVIGEQGLGDYVLFGSMLNDLLQVQKTISVMINDRLLSIFKRSFPTIKFIKFDNNFNKYKYDKYIFFGSLGKYFRNSVESFPKNQVSFLCPKKNYVLEMKKLFKKNNKIKIGISWKTASKNNRNERNIDLVKFEKLFNNKNLEFIDLQYGNTNKERSLIYNKFGVKFRHFKNIDYTNDIEKLAALISECDLVITIANFTTQLSGSMGIPTWVLLPYSCHWRWFVNRTNSLWYPSVKLFRQKKWNHWNGVINDVSKSLKNFK